MYVLCNNNIMNFDRQQKIFYKINQFKMHAKLMVLKKSFLYTGTNISAYSIYKKKFR